MSQSKPFRLGAAHAISIFVGAFAVIIGVNATFVTLALRSFPGEEVPKSYLQGLHYNETLRDRAEQTALGWSAAADFAAAPTALVELDLRDAAGAPLDAVEISATLRRPASAALDRPLLFASRGGGRYAAPAADLAPGQWELTARVTRGEAHFDIRKRLIWLPRS